jgi:biofilm protein TabA
MIISDLKHWEQDKHYHAPVIQKALEWIKNADVNMAPGKYPIEENRMYAIIQRTETQPMSEKLAEAHQEYIDVQYLLSGEELIRVVRDSGNNEVWSDELVSHDRLLYKHLVGEMDIVLKPHMFVVFYPSDIHRACCNVNGNLEIKKAVIKIHRSLF